LLRQYDISYYLLEQPPAFWIAAGLMGTIGTAMGAVLIGMLLPVIYALPLVVFEGVKPQQAFRASRQRAVGHFRSLGTWVVSWMAATFALSTLATSSIALLGTLILPMTHRFLWLALTAVGLLLILSGIINLCLNILGTTTFSIVMMNLYRGVKHREASALPFSVPAHTKELFLLRMSRRQLAIVSIAVLMVMPAVGVLFLHGIETRDSTEIVAHRGASAVAPENSMAAVEQAIADQADWLEIDVQMSSDGMILVIHDGDLTRVAGRNVKVSDTHSKQLRSTDIGKKFSPEFTGQMIPTLEEVLVACKGKIGVVIELKHYGQIQELEERVIDLVEAHDMSAQVKLMSLKYDSIKKVRARRPSWQIGLLSAVCVGDLTKADADFLAVSTRMATRAFVLLARRRGKSVYVWTVNDPVVMSTMISRGVKCIITDKPALAREVLRQRADMAPLERLLLELAILCGAVPGPNINNV
jgi:glycerophosphoryl diester phosphodiesterase